MASLSNQRHELFAQAMAKGASGPDAYIAAGYDVAPAVASASASRLLNDVKIQARIKELQERGAEKAIKTIGLTRAWVLDRLMKHADICLGLEKVKVVRVIKSRLKDDSGGFTDAVQTVEVEVTERDAPAANRALELLGREVEGAPLFVERKEVGRPGDFDNLTDEELERRYLEQTAGLNLGRQNGARDKPTPKQKSVH